jgi:hypothetical protein
MHPIDIGAIATIVVAISGFILPIIARAVKASDQIGGLISSITKNGLVTHDQIDKAVESILSGGRPPSKFIDAIGDVVADLILRLPAYLQLPREDKIRMVASIFSQQTKDKVASILPQLPENILSMLWARRQVVEGTLNKTSVIQEAEAKSA